MQKRVYDYYREELDYLRHYGAEFAKAHSEIASLLDFGTTPDEDPFVRRLVESFALLTARVRLKLDDEFPRISEAVLEQLLPFSLRPLPSFSIAQFQLGAESADVTEPQMVKRGELFELRTKSHVKFTTGFPVKVWPIKIQTASYKCAPFDAPRNVIARKPQARLEIELSTFTPQMKLADLGVDEVVFHISDPNYGFGIHELIVNTFRNLVAAVVVSADQTKVVELPPTAIEPVGLTEQELMLPYDGRGNLGHQLVAEFLAFPQKHLFFRVKMQDAAAAMVGSQAKLQFYFREPREALEKIVRTNTFHLGCTPVVNLFEYPAPAEVDLDNQHTHYEVVPDKSLPTAYEVYNIFNVRAFNPRGEVENFEPFFSRATQFERSRQVRYWHARRTRWPGDRINGSQLALSFVDTALQPADMRQVKSVRLQTMCTNREFFNLHRARTQSGISDDIPLESYAGQGKLNSGRLIHPFTEAVPAREDSQHYLQLISNLNTNLMSFARPHSVELLKKELSDLDLAELDRNRDLLDKLVDLRVESCVEKLMNLREVDTHTPPASAVAGRTNSPAANFARHGLAACRGSKIVITVAKNKLEDSAWWQLFSVLNRFFAYYVSINSFSKLEIVEDVERDCVARFDPMCGRKMLT